MDTLPLLVPALINSLKFVDAQVDTGCDCYAAVSEKFAQRMGLEQVPLGKRRRIRTAVETKRRGVVRQESHSTISHLVQFTLDMDGWESQVAAYVVPGLTRDVILGMPWMIRYDVCVRPARRELTIGATSGLVIKGSNNRATKNPTIAVLGSVFAGLVRQAQRKQEECRLIATSLREVTSVLRVPGAEPEQERGQTPQLPDELRDFRDLFDQEKANELPPHRGQLDHHIRLKKHPDGSDPELPWAPLYNMPREHLLEIRKQVTDLMDKGWIRASSSPAAAPVLLAKKPGGGWRFCVDYRALNKVTEQDRYPLPLVKETLRSLSEARWFTKLDVRSAFHRLRIAPGEEHLTAFRTRFGLFEWLVCPFGLAGAPATFQRYINGALGKLLGDFATAYLDDILIYSGGSRKDHMRKVREVLTRLRAAGLYLDIKKCAFCVQEVKYLGFIVRAGKEIRPDPEKIEAIRSWEPPTRQRGVRGFLGFANFYRDFIPDFSSLTGPLLGLLKKGVQFKWSKECNNAFESLKKAFMSYPVLKQWDPARETVVEADCSIDALGGCLSQFSNGILHPVAYHSARLTAPERNYTIHDKELLAVISCLKAWSAELRSVTRPFTILTDHKNLEYFTSPKEMSERQARWAETLSLFNFHLRYRPGTQAQRPDALSRRDQDRNTSPPRFGSIMQPTNMSPLSLDDRALAADSREAANETADPLPGAKIFSDNHLQSLWDQGMFKDEAMAQRIKAVQEDARRFPKEANTREQIADCTLSAHGTLMFRGRTWAPKWEPLTTTLIQRVHDSPMAGHPGKNSTFKLLQRDYHWEGMSQDVARFVRNCHCYGGHKSRQLRQGLLQPIPIADRYWSQISIDFMTDLPAREKGDARYLMVITDRLSKYVQLEAMTSMGAEACAERFKHCWWRFHGFPSQIITDRGSDWLSKFWTTLCKLVGTTQLLSTAYHPQTDGGTERANQEVQAVLRVTISFEQFDWTEHLAACQLALNNRDSTVIGMSPNKALHGFDMAPIQEPPRVRESKTSAKGRAVAFINHLREGTDLAQAAIAFAQQRAQDSTNRQRRPAEKFRVGDSVWLSLRNVKTNRPSKKLDWVMAKYKVIDVPTPLTVKLDVPGGIHPVFHVDLLERAASDPLPSQELQDSRPGPKLTWTDDEVGGQLIEEFEVEEILAVKNAPGRGQKRKAYVKWQGYFQPTWEPLENIRDTAALDRFENRWGDARWNDGPVPPPHRVRFAAPRATRK